MTLSAFAVFSRTSWFCIIFISAFTMEKVDRYIFNSLCRDKYVNNKITYISVTRTYVNNVFFIFLMGDLKMFQVSITILWRSYQNERTRLSRMTIPGKDGVHTHVLTVPKRIQECKTCAKNLSHRE